MASIRRVFGEFKLLIFQEERAQSVVRGMQRATAEGKTSCVSECHRRPFARLLPPTFNRDALLRELAGASSVLTHTNNMPESNTNTHTMLKFTLIISTLLP